MTAACFAAIYLAICLIVHLSYRAILFPAPHATVSAPRGATLIETPAADGQTVHALYFPGSPVIALFHGNGETIADNIPLAQALVASGGRRRTGQAGLPAPRGG